MAIPDVNPQKWFVLIAKSNFDRKAAKVLRNYGYTVYLPLQRQLHYWTDRKKTIEVPVLSPYIFIKVNEIKRKEVYNYAGMVHFLMQAGKPAMVKDQEIENLRMLCNYTQNLTLDRSNIKKGNLVDIISGPLSGMRGSAYQENGQYKFRIQIDSLGFFANVEVESSCLKTVTK